MIQLSQLVYVNQYVHTRATFCDLTAEKNIVLIKLIQRYLLPHLRVPDGFAYLFEMKFSLTSSIINFMMITD